MEYGSTIDLSVSLCNIDIENKVNEKLEQIITIEQICTSTQHINEPRVGLEFNCTEDAKKFYNYYAFKMGFSIKKNIPLQGKRIYPVSMPLDSDPMGRERERERERRGGGVCRDSLK